MSRSEKATLNRFLHAIGLSVDAAQVVIRVLDDWDDCECPLSVEGIIALFPAWGFMRAKSALAELWKNGLMVHDEDNGRECLDVHGFHQRYDELWEQENGPTVEYLQTLARTEALGVLSVDFSWLLQGECHQDIWYPAPGLNVMIIDFIRAHLKAHGPNEICLAIENYSKALCSDTPNAVPIMSITEFFTELDDNGNWVWTRFLVDGGDDA